MALDLQQQEELEEVKRVWHSWLKWVVLFIMICALFYLGYTAWSNYQQKKDEEATDLLMQFQSLMEERREKEALATLKTLQEDYSDTMSAATATSTIGSLSFYTNRISDAARHYQWVLDHQKNKFIRAMTITNLAKIKMQQQQFDEALALLNEKTEPEFQFLLEDIKGDIFIAKGDEAAAQKAYDKAISLLPKENEVITEDDIAQVRAQIEAKKIIKIPRQ